MFLLLQIPNLRKLLFSATDYNDLAKLKEEFLMPNATKVVVGAVNSVNPFIEQRVVNVHLFLNLLVFNSRFISNS